MDTRDDWTASFSLHDYQSAIVAEIDFIRTVNDHDSLIKPGQTLNNAVRRYETLWLPLLCSRAAAGDGAWLVPPLDVYWVWHCHMLSPASYRRDCLSLVGTVLDHAVHWLTVDQISYSRQKWRAAFAGESYDMAPSSAFATSTYRQRSSYDLMAACVRQGTFYYNVSLPHYKDWGFIENAVRRYKKFLYVKRCYPRQFLAPCYDVDLVWHTHLLHPLIYAQDTLRYLGCIFDHDDTESDRGPESNLSMSNEATRFLWKAVFNEDYALSGTMYRGLPPNGKLAAMSQAEVSAIRPRQGTISIDSIVVERPPSRRVVLTVSTKDQLDVEFAQHAARHRYSDALVLSAQPLVRMRFGSTSDETLRVKLKRVKTCRCFGSSGREYVCHCSLFRLLPPDGGEVGERLPFSLLRQAGPSTLRLEGFTVIEALSRNVVLNFQPGQFDTVVLPKRAELLWGPTPVGNLPLGADDVCLVATHRLLCPCVPNAGTKRFLVRVIHCLPLLMSAVQVFIGEKMVALAHLVGPEQVPDSSLPMVSDKGKCITINSRNGERGFVIKNNRGDWGFVFGSWVNARRGITGQGDQQLVGGYTGKLRVRFARLQPSLGIMETDTMIEDNFTFEIPGLSANLRSGEMTLDFEEVAEEVALAFSVAALQVLCQPPPPGSKPPTRHGTAGRVSMASTTPTISMRSSGPIAQVHSTPLALVAAAGWMLPTPSNYYLEERRLIGGDGYTNQSGSIDVGRTSATTWSGDGRDSYQRSPGYRSAAAPAHASAGYGGCRGSGDGDDW